MVPSAFTATLQQGIAAPILAGCLLLGGCKGATVTPVAQLKSAAKTGDDLAAIQLDRIVFNLSRGQTIGAYRAGGAYTGCGSGGFSPRPLAWPGLPSERINNEMRGIFAEEMGQAGYNVAGNSNELFADMSSNPVDAEYLVGGRVDSIVMDVCNEVSTWDGRALGTQSGEIGIEMTWQVFSTLERQVVYETMSRGSAVLEEGVPDGEEALLIQGIAAAAANLAADQKFHGLLLSSTRQEAAAATAQSSGHLPSVQLPLVPAFTGTLDTNIRRIQASVVTVRSGNSQGSGFFVAPDLVLTNAHVVGTIVRHKIILADESEIYATVLRRDSRRDVALLQAETGSHAALPLRLGRPNLAEEVYAVGSPIDESLAGTVTRGIVSQLKQDKQGLDFIQADVTIQPGSSGGPLLDARGSVIGLSQSGLTDGTAHSIGINFFIPIADALKHLNLVHP